MKRRLALSLVLLVLAAPLVALAQTRIEIPIRQVDLSDGAPRYAVRMTVNGAAVEAGLDSGSTGLRILPGVVADDVARGGRTTIYSYDSGTELKGVIGPVTIGFGDGAVSGPVPVQLVKTVGCRAAKPDCPARKIPQSQFGIQGDGLSGEGFKAILGINMANDDAPNPLARLGVKRWIIELPLRTSSAAGRLVLNPTDAEVENYTVLKIDPNFSDRHGGLHDAIRGCLSDQKTRRSFCGPLDLDTGAPGIHVISPSREPGWANGDPGQLVIYDGTKPVQAVMFVVGRREQSSRVTIDPEPRAPAPRIQMGTMPYYAFDVLYDPQAGTVGLKAR